MKLSRFCKFIPLTERHSLAVNSLCRSIVEIDNSIVEYLSLNREQNYDNRNDGLIPNEEIDLLKDGGILVNDDNKELSSFYEWLRTIQLDFSKIKAVILLTSKCNLNCTYCFEKGPLADTKQDMTDGVALSIVDWLKALAEKKKSKELDVYFYGGEPALKVAMMERMINKLRMAMHDNGIGVHFHMFTSGTILSSDLMRILKNNDFKMVQITLDGPRIIHNKRRPFRNGRGTFDIVYRNVKRILAETSTHVRIVVNFDANNYQFIPELLDMFTGLQGTNLEFAYNPVFITSKNAPACRQHSLPSRESARIWAELYKETLQRGFYCHPLRIFETGPCTFHRASHLVFDPIGNIYKCIGMPGREEYKVGNIAENLDHVLERILWMTKIAPWDNSQCLNCVYLPLCLGGCRFHSLEENGNINDMFCHKELIDCCEMELIKYSAIKGDLTGAFSTLN